jgi:hypothetical protein
MQSNNHHAHLLFFPFRLSLSHAQGSLLQGVKTKEAPPETNGVSNHSEAAGNGGHVAVAVGGNRGSHVYLEGIRGNKRGERRCGGGSES